MNRASGVTVMSAFAALICFDRYDGEKEFAGAGAFCKKLHL